MDDVVSDLRRRLGTAEAEIAACWGMIRELRQERASLAEALTAAREDQKGRRHGMQSVRQA